MGDWTGWFQDLSKAAVNTYGQIEQQKSMQKAEIARLELEARNQYGVPYVEGIAPLPQGGIPMSWLLIGAVLVAVVVLKD